MSGQLLSIILCLKLLLLMLSVEPKVMLIIGGMNEKQKGKNVKVVVNIKFVNDHGKNIR
jgi:hypothetical protein